MSAHPHTVILNHSCLGTRAPRVVSGAPAGHPGADGTHHPVDALDRGRIGGAPIPTREGACATRPLLHRSGLESACGCPCGNGERGRPARRQWRPAAGIGGRTRNRNRERVHSRCVRRGAERCGRGARAPPIHHPRPFFPSSPRPGTALTSPANARRRLHLTLRARRHRDLFPLQIGGGIRRFRRDPHGTPAATGWIARTTAAADRRSRAGRGRPAPRT